MVSPFMGELPFFTCLKKGNPKKRHPAYLPILETNMGSLRCSIEPAGCETRQCGETTQAQTAQPFFRLNFRFSASLNGTIGQRQDKNQTLRREDAPPTTRPMYPFLTKLYRLLWEARPRGE